MSYTLVESNGVITLDSQGAGHLFRILPDTLFPGNITVNGTLSGGGVLTNPMTTLGDIITGGAAGTATRLGVGSNTQVLTVVGGVPAWAAAGGGGGTSITNGGGTVAVSAAGAITDTPASGQNDTLTLAGGGSFNSTGGIFNVNVSSNFASNLNTGTSTGAVAIGNTTAGALTLASGAASTFQVTAATLTLGTLTSGTTALTSAGVLTLTGAGASTWSLTSGALIIQNASANLTIQTTTSGTLALTGVAALTLTGGAASTWSVTAGGLTINSTSADLVLQTTTSGDVELEPASAGNILANLLGGGAFLLAGGQASLTPTETVASASGAVWDGLTVPATTLTLSGNTNITTATGLNLVTIGQPTMSAAQALTITNPTTMTIIGPPIMGGAGPASGTNIRSFWVQAGVSLFAGAVTVSAGGVTISAGGLASTGNTQTLVGVAASGGATLLTATPGAHTAVTAEVIDYDHAAHTMTITGGYATQRFALFRQPTITAASALTVTTAATLVIAGAPIAAGSAVITNAYSLWVQAGNASFAGSISVAAAAFFAAGSFTGSVTTTSGFVGNNGGLLALDCSGATGTILLRANNGATNLLTLTTTAATLTDAINFVLGTTNGTKFGTATTQKLGFWNATPVVQTTGSTDVLAGLVTVGLRAASSNPPLNLGTGQITAGAASLSATISTYNNVATVGWGVPAIYAYVRPAQQVNTTVTLATYTVGAADGSFLVSANVNVTVSTTVAMTVTCSYTDEANVARVLTLPFTILAGTFVASITSAQGNVPYEGVPMRIRAKSATSITIATAGTVTATTYTAEADIQQVA